MTFSETAARIAIEKPGTWHPMSEPRLLLAHAVACCFGGAAVLHHNQEAAPFVAELVGPSSIFTVLAAEVHRIDKSCVWGAFQSLPDRISTASGRGADGGWPSTDLHLYSYCAGFLREVRHQVMGDRAESDLNERAVHERFPQAVPYRPIRSLAIDGSVANMAAIDVRDLDLGALGRHPAPLAKRERDVRRPIRDA